MLVLVEEEVLMEGGRLDWGECNRESDGSGAVEPGNSESARSGSGRGPGRGGDKQVGPASQRLPPRCCGGGSAASARRPAAPGSLFFCFFLRCLCSCKFLAGFSNIRKKVLFILYESDSGALSLIL